MLEIRSTEDQFYEKKITKRDYPYYIKYFHVNTLSPRNPWKIWCKYKEVHFIPFIPANICKPPNFSSIKEWLKIPIYSYSRIHYY